MITATATATEMKNNFEQFIPKDSAVSYLTDSLTGILKEDCSLDKIKVESLREKYDLVMQLY